MKTIQKMPYNMYVENEPAMKRNEAVLNELSGELYIIEANDKFPDNCKHPLALIQAAQSQKQKKHRRFSKVAEVKNWCKSDVNS